MILKALTIITLAGAYLNSAGNPYLASIVWSVTNPILCWHNHCIGQKEQSAIFGAFSLLAWWGVMNLA